MTKTQRIILNTCQSTTVRRWSEVAAVRYGRRSTDTTYKFFWAADRAGSPGKPLSERVIADCEREGWLTTESPPHPPATSMRDMMAQNAQMTLVLTDKGREALKPA